MRDLKAWREVAPRLVDVAAGRTPADLVVRRGRWVNVHSGEIVPATDIAISAEFLFTPGRIFYPENISLFNFLQILYIV